MVVKLRTLSKASNNVIVNNPKKEKTRKKVLSLKYVGVKTPGNYSNVNQCMESQRSQVGNVQSIRAVSPPWFEPGSSYSGGRQGKMPLRHPDHPTTLPPLKSDALSRPRHATFKGFLIKNNTLSLNWIKTQKHIHLSWRIPLHIRSVTAWNLKALDTFDNCQKPAFSLGVSQQMHKITILWKLKLNWSSKLRDNNGRKTPLSHTKLFAFRCLISGTQNLIRRSQNRIQKF